MRIRLFALGHGWKLRESLGSERQGSTYGSWRGCGPWLPGRPAVQEFVGIGGERSWDPSFLPQASWKPAALGAGRARVGLSRELAETRREGPAGSEAVPRGPAPRRWADGEALSERGNLDGKKEFHEMGLDPQHSPDPISLHPGTHRLAPSLAHTNARV